MDVIFILGVILIVFMMIIILYFATQTLNHLEERSVKKNIENLAQQIRVPIKEKDGNLEKNNMKWIKESAWKIIRFIGLIFILFLCWRLFEFGFYSGSIFVFVLSVLLILVFSADYHNDIIEYFKRKD